MCSGRKARAQNKSLRRFLQVGDWFLLPCQAAVTREGGDEASHLLLDQPLPCWSRNEPRDIGWRDEPSPQFALPFGMGRVNVREGDGGKKRGEWRR